MPEQPVSTFREIFGEAPTWEASAPGRVNLIGEHVDYCDGFVLPMAIDRRVTLEAIRVLERRITLRSIGMADAQIELGAGPLAPGQPSWSNYVRGVLAGFARRGAELPGMKILISSDVPAGGGLSSSAALEVAVATLLGAVTGHSISPLDTALLCQQAEHEFAGVPCGIMDQFASVFGRAGHVLLIDCRSRQVELIPFQGDVSVLIVDTRVKHELAGNEYAQRRSECEQACRLLGVASFRDLVGTPWHSAVAGLAEPCRRRARHVLAEIERVPAFVSCLRRADWAAAGKLMYASHQSLRDDFEVSCPELDFVVEQAASLNGVLGCRMTGGGFGGCCVALVAKEQVAATQQALRAAYYARYNIESATYVTEPADGPRVRKI